MLKSNASAQSGIELESAMIIEAVELVNLPNAPAWQEKIYRAHLDTGDDVDLFQQLWDVPLSPESLVGLTVSEARERRMAKILAIAGGRG
jgi:hypothetical protein